MRARHTPMRLPMVTALGLGMLAARAYGLTILDGVYNDIRDVEGFRTVCQQGLEMGFDGKTLIHPNQVEPCNEVFAPSVAELEMAGKIVAAFKLRKLRQGVVTVDGRMIETSMSNRPSAHWRWRRRSRNCRPRHEQEQDQHRQLLRGFRIGQEIRHATPRTLTEADAALNIGLYGSRFAINSSDVSPARSACRAPRSTTSWSSMSSSARPCPTSR